MRRSDHDAVGQTCFAAAVVGEDGMRDRGGGGVLVLCRQHHLDLIRRQHFDGAIHRGPGKRVGVDAEKERSVDFLLLAVQANRLGDRQDVPLIERPVEG